jgi:hypothetical protein
VRQKLKAILPTPLLNLRFVFSAAPLAYRPGHFYSAICDPTILERYYRDPRTSRTPQEAIRGIDFNEQEQRGLWEAWTSYLRAFPFPETKRDFRYFYQNAAFAVGDAMILHCVLRHFKPRRIIEIGSGFSSACTLDTIEHHLGDDVRCTFVDPHPELLYGIMTQRDRSRHAVIPKQVQDVPLETFDQLEPNDILFIDSTHVLKTGSDVAFELFEVLPRLKKGVIIHIHDMFYPFEYPREWVIDSNRSWNEVYAVRALLMNNPDFRILFFNDYFGRFADDLIKRDAPRMLENIGGSLWIQRT